MVKRSPQPNRVRAHRRLAEMTQADLAAAIGVSRQTVISIEGDDYSPSVFLALDVASALDTTVEALFGTARDSNNTTNGSEHVAQ